MTSLYEHVSRVAAALEERVQHLMAHQPLLTECVGREIDSVALPDPPGVGHFPGQFNSARGSVYSVKIHLSHFALTA